MLRAIANDRSMPKQCRRYAASETLGTKVRGLTPTAKRCHRCAVCAVAVLIVIPIGCTSRPARVQVPDFDPDEIGARAIERYDKDGDGSLSAMEREKVKSLDSAMGRMDKDDDGRLTAEEIAARIQFYYEFKAGLLPVYCTLVRGGRPVAGAKVTYEPEEFMGEGALPAYGTTDSRGSAMISMAEEHLPSPALTGVRPGFYRIRVTMADGSEATKLNAGIEVAGDVMNSHTFALP